jgi:hypothetical protein
MEITYIGFEKLGNYKVRILNAIYIDVGGGAKGPPKALTLKL